METDPKKIAIYLTNKCNLRCKHCFIEGSPLNDLILPWAKIKVALKHFRHQGYDLVEFTGGEAYCSPYLSKSIKLANQLGYKVGICTNGTNPELIEQYKTSEINKFTFSLDGFNAKTHDFLRGKGVYKKCISTMKKSIKLGFKTDVIFTVHRFNIDEIPEVIKLLDKMGVNQLSFNFISNSGSASLHQQFLLPPKFWQKAKKLIKKNSHVNKLILRFPELFLTQKQFNDFRHQQSYFCRLLEPVKIELYPNGNFYHCCFLAINDTIPAGKIRGNKVITNTAPEIEFAKKYKHLTCPDYQTRGQIYAPSSKKLIPICLYYKTIIKPSLN